MILLLLVRRAVELLTRRELVLLMFSLTVV